MENQGSSRRKRAERAALSLTTLEREVLSLSANRGLRNREIAELLGISERRVVRLLAAALCKFDRELSAD